MTITTIIPVYNRATVVTRTLQSVLVQHRLPDELVLVDNCSTDDTLRVLEKFKVEHDSAKMRIKVVQESVHTAGAARNCGLAQATSEWVMFFDSDDVMLPQLVSSYAQAIEAHCKANIVTVKAELHRQDGSVRSLTAATSDLLANHLLHGIMATQRYAARRDLVIKAGSWNATLPGWNDWEMGLRLLLNPEAHVTNLGKVLVHINDSGSASITGTEFHSRCGQWEHVIDLMQGEIEAADLHDKEKTRYQRLLDYRRVVLAAQYAAEGRPELGRELYTRAYGRLKAQRPMLGVIVPWLYHRIRTGKRGSARIARILI